MPFLNKDKLMNGIGKAVDVVNDTADKAARYAKEKEWDKKIDNAAHSLEKGVEDIGKSFKDTFSKK
jgi:cytochrome oxidase Cu insertion factor (SCO1/SenC/PrrC family)